MHESEDVIGDARRVGVVLLDAQVRFVVPQAVQHVGEVAHANVDGVLVGASAAKLARLGVQTATDLAALEPADARSLMTVTGGQVVYGYTGFPACL